MSALAQNGPRFSRPLAPVFHQARGMRARALSFSEPRMRRTKCDALAGLQGRSGIAIRPSEAARNSPSIDRCSAFSRRCDERRLGDQTPSLIAHAGAREDARARRRGLLRDNRPRRCRKRHYLGDVARAHCFPVLFFCANNDISLIILPL